MVQMRYIYQSTQINRLQLKKQKQMQGRQEKIISPERSRSIKLKVSNKIFPQDFFKRSTSQSPIKQIKKLRYIKENTQKNTNPQFFIKNHFYWDLMRQELDKCRNFTHKHKLKQMQRISVYSQKKNRRKENREAEVKFQSKHQSRKNIQEQKPVQFSPQDTKYQIKQGLFTFFGKSHTKSNNSWLPSIN